MHVAAGGVDVGVGVCGVPGSVRLHVLRPRAACQYIGILPVPAALKVGFLLTQRGSVSSQPPEPCWSLKGYWALAQLSMADRLDLLSSEVLLVACFGVRGMIQYMY